MLGKAYDVLILQPDSAKFILKKKNCSWQIHVILELKNQRIEKEGKVRK